VTESKYSEKYIQLEQAIAALEAQRVILGNAVVNPAIAGLQIQLAEFEEDHIPQTLKQVTVLFADITGFTTISERMDAEQICDMMDSVWKQLDAIILEHGGMIDKHLGDGVMAFGGQKRPGRMTLNAPSSLHWRCKKLCQISI